MTPAEDLIEIARTWIGTPYVHQGRLKGVGVDCVGLIACSALEAGLISQADYDSLPVNYSRQANLATLRQQVIRFLRPVSAAQPGDVFSFRFALHDQHLGLYTGNGIIHVLIDRTGVVEVPFNGFLARAQSGVWRFPSCN